MTPDPIKDLYYDVSGKIKGLTEDQLRTALSSKVNAAKFYNKNQNELGVEYDYWMSHVQELDDDRVALQKLNRDRVVTKAVGDQAKQKLNQFAFPSIDDLKKVKTADDRVTELDSEIAQTNAKVLEKEKQVPSPVQKLKDYNLPGERAYNQGIVRGGVQDDIAYKYQGDVAQWLKDNQKNLRAYLPEDHQQLYDAIQEADDIKTDLAKTEKQRSEILAKKDRTEQDNANLMLFDNHLLYGSGKAFENNNKQEGIKLKLNKEIDDYIKAQEGYKKAILDKHSDSPYGGVPTEERQKIKEIDEKIRKAGLRKAAVFGDTEAIVSSIPDVTWDKLELMLGSEMKDPIARATAYGISLDKIIKQKVAQRNDLAKKLLNTNEMSPEYTAILKQVSNLSSEVDDLNSQLEDLAPIATLNRSNTEGIAAASSVVMGHYAPDISEFGKGVMRQMFEDENIFRANDAKARLAYSMLSDLDVIKSTTPQYLESNIEQQKPSKQTVFGEMTGASLDLAGDIIAAGVITKNLGGIGKALLDIPKVKAIYDRANVIKKVAQGLPRFSKYAGEAVKEGIRYEIAGYLDPSRQQDLTFNQGLLGGAAANLFSKGSTRLIQGLFGKNIDDLPVFWKHSMGQGIGNYGKEFIEENAQNTDQLVQQYGGWMGLLADAFKNTDNFKDFQRDFRDKIGNLHAQGDLAESIGFLSFFMGHALPIAMGSGLAAEFDDLMEKHNVDKQLLADINHYMTDIRTLRYGGQNYHFDGKDWVDNQRNPVDEETKKALGAGKPGEHRTIGGKRIFFKSGQWVDESGKPVDKKVLKDITLEMKQREAQSPFVRNAEIGLEQRKTELENIENRTESQENELNDITKRLEEISNLQESKTGIENIEAVLPEDQQLIDSEPELLRRREQILTDVENGVENQELKTELDNELKSIDDKLKQVEAAKSKSAEIETKKAELPVIEKRIAELKSPYSIPGKEVKLEGEEAEVRAGEQLYSEDGEIFNSEGRGQKYVFNKDAVLDKVGDGYAIRGESPITGSFEVSGATSYKLSQAIKNASTPTKRALKVVRELVPMMKQLGVTIRLHDNKSFRELGQGLARGYYDPQTKQIHLNLSHVRANTGAHEILHPFFNAVFEKYPELKTKFFNGLAEEYKQYSALTGAVDEGIVEYSADQLVYAITPLLDRDKGFFGKILDFIRRFLIDMGFTAIQVQKIIDTETDLSQLLADLSGNLGKVKFNVLQREALKSEPKQGEVQKQNIFVSSEDRVKNIAQKLGVNTDQTVFNIYKGIEQRFDEMMEADHSYKGEGVDAEFIRTRQQSRIDEWKDYLRSADMNIEEKASLFYDILNYDFGYKKREAGATHNFEPIIGKPDVYYLSYPPSSPVDEWQRITVGITQESTQKNIEKIHRLTAGKNWDISRNAGVYLGKGDVYVSDKNFAVVSSGEVIGNLNDEGYDDLIGKIPEPQFQTIGGYGDYNNESINLIYDEEGDHLAPNGKKSLLTEKQAKIVRTQQFKNWFGDWENNPEESSKVIDENGEPLVVYHGSHSLFTEFDVTHEEKNDVGWLGRGNYFSSKHIAEVYRKNKVERNRQKEGYIYEVFLNIRNPYVTTFDEKYKKNIGFSSEKAISYTNDKIEKGYDGVIAKGENQVPEFNAFEPNQIKLADGSNVTFDPNSNNIQFQTIGGFYSPLQKKISEFKAEQYPAKKWLELIGRGDEAVFTGLRGFLEDKPEGEQVKKSEIQGYLRDNPIKIEQVVKGADNMDWREKNGVLRKDYGKVELEITKDDEGWYKVWDGDTKIDDEIQHISVAKSRADEYAYLQYGVDTKENSNTEHSQYQLKGDKDNYKEILIILPKSEESEFRRLETKKFVEGLDEKETQQWINLKNKNRVVDFNEGHFDEKNIILHIRSNERVDNNGDKILFLEEIQSTWAQRGRKYGFSKNLKDKEVIEWAKNNGYTFNKKGEYIEVTSPEGRVSESRYENHIADAIRQRENLNGIPLAPYIQQTKDWTKLSLKVALQEAVKTGAKKIAWTTGEQQNERYDLSKQVSEIKWNAGTETLYATKLNGEEELISDGVKKEDLEKYVGKDAAKKLIESEYDEEYSDAVKTLKGENLKVEGKGMIGFYGSPTENKLGIVGEVAKSLFGKVETVEIELDKNTLLNESYAEEQPNGRYNVWNGKFRVWQVNLSKEAAFNTVEKLNLKYVKKSTYTQHSVTITPEIREQVQQGLPQFQQIGKNSVNLQYEDLQNQTIQSANTVVVSATQEEINNRGIETFIGDDQRRKEAAAGVIQRQDIVGSKPFTRLTLAVFNEPQFEKMRGQQVNPQSIRDLVKSRGKQIEKDLINAVLDLDKYKQKRVSFDEFRSDVEVQIMRLEKITVNKYNTYGADRLGGGYGGYDNAKSVVLNSPLEHGYIGNHYKEEFYNSENLEIRTWELKQIPTTDSWVAIDKNAPALTQENIYDYVGTSGSKEDVEKWIEDRKSFEGRTINRGMFGHFRTWVDGDIMYIPEMQSDYYQNNKASDILAKQIPQYDIDEYVNKSLKPIDQELADKIADQFGLTVQKTEGSWNVYDKDGVFLTAESIGQPLPGWNEGEFEKYRAYVTGLNSLSHRYPKYVLTEDGKHVIYHFNIRIEDGVKFETEDEAREYQKEKEQEAEDARISFEELRSEYTKKRNDVKRNKEQEYIRKRVDELRKEKPNLILDQFIASQKVHELRILKEAIAHAAQNNAEEIRIPLPYTMAVLENYVQSSEINDPPYEILDGDDNRLEQGDIIRDGGTRMVVVESDSNSIWVANEDSAFRYDVDEYINEEVVNRRDEIEYEAEKYFNDMDAITREEIESYDPDEWMADEAMVILKSKAEDLEEGETLKWDDIVGELEESIDDRYRAMSYDELFSFGREWYEDGNHFVWVVEGNTERLGQPETYTYEEDVTEDNFEDNLSSDYQTVVDKYKFLNEEFKKLRGDVERVDDENGFPWLSSKITEADKTNPIVAFQRIGNFLRRETMFRPDEFGDLSTVPVQDRIRNATADEKSLVLAGDLFKDYWEGDKINLTRLEDKFNEIAESFKPFEEENNDDGLSKIKALHVLRYYARVAGKEGEEVEKRMLYRLSKGGTYLGQAVAGFNKDLESEYYELPPNMAAEFTYRNPNNGKDENGEQRNNGEEAMYVLDNVLNKDYFDKIDALIENILGENTDLKAQIERMNKEKKTKSVLDRKGDKVFEEGKKKLFVAIDKLKKANILSSGGLNPEQLEAVTEAFLAVIEMTKGKLIQAKEYFVAAMEDASDWTEDQINKIWEDLVNGHGADIENERKKYAIERLKNYNEKKDSKKGERDVFDALFDRLKTNREKSNKSAIQKLFLEFQMEEQLVPVVNQAIKDLENEMMANYMEDTDENEIKRMEVWRQISKLRDFVDDITGTTRKDNLAKAAVRKGLRDAKTTMRKVIYDYFTERAVKRGLAEEIAKAFDTASMSDQEAQDFFRLVQQVKAVVFHRFDQDIAAAKTEEISKLSKTYRADSIIKAMKLGAIDDVSFLAMVANNLGADYVTPHILKVMQMINQLSKSIQMNANGTLVANAQSAKAQRILSLLKAKMGAGFAKKFAYAVLNNMYTNMLTSPMTSVLSLMGAAVSAVKFIPESLYMTAKGPNERRVAFVAVVKFFEDLRDGFAKAWGYSVNKREKNALNDEEARLQARDGMERLLFTTYKSLLKNMQGHIAENTLKIIAKTFYEPIHALYRIFVATDYLTSPFLQGWNERMEIHNQYLAAHDDMRFTTRQMFDFLGDEMGYTDEMKAVIDSEIASLGYSGWRATEYRAKRKDELRGEYMRDHVFKEISELQSRRMLSLNRPEGKLSRLYDISSSKTHLQEDSNSKAFLLSFFGRVAMPFWRMALNHTNRYFSNSGVGIIAAVRKYNRFRGSDGVELADREGTHTRIDGKRVDLIYTGRDAYMEIVESVGLILLSQLFFAGFYGDDDDEKGNRVKVQRGQWRITGPGIGLTSKDKEIKQYRANMIQRMNDSGQWIDVFNFMNLTPNPWMLYQGMVTEKTVFDTQGIGGETGSADFIKDLIIMLGIAPTQTSFNQGTRTLIDLLSIPNDVFEEHKGPSKIESVVKQLFTQIFNPRGYDYWSKVVMGMIHAPQKKDSNPYWDLLAKIPVLSPFWDTYDFDPFGRRVIPEQSLPVINNAFEGWAKDLQGEDDKRLEQIKDEFKKLDNVVGIYSYYYPGSVVGDKKFPVISDLPVDVQSQLQRATAVIYGKTLLELYDMELTKAGIKAQIPGENFNKAVMDNINGLRETSILAAKSKILGDYVYEQLTDVKTNKFLEEIRKTNPHLFEGDKLVGNLGVVKGNPSQEFTLMSALLSLSRNAAEIDMSPYGFPKKPYYRREINKWQLINLNNWSLIQDFCKHRGFTFDNNGLQFTPRITEVEKRQMNRAGIDTVGIRN